MKIINIINSVDTISDVSYLYFHSTILVLIIEGIIYFKNRNSVKNISRAGIKGREPEQEKKGFSAGFITILAICFFLVTPLFSGASILTLTFKEIVLFGILSGQYFANILLGI